MKRQLIRHMLTICLVFVFSGIASAKAFYCTNCSTKLVQSLEQVQSYVTMRDMAVQIKEAYQQTIHQFNILQQEIAQYQNMVQNTMQLPAEIIAEVKGKMAELARLYEKIKTFRGDIVALGQIFAELYPDQSFLANLAGAAPDKIDDAIAQYRDHWDKWTKRVDESAQATFQLSGHQLEKIQKDAAAFDNHLHKLLSTPDGQMKAIMAGNQLASLHIQEARQLRELMATFVQSEVQSQMKGEKEGQMSQEVWRDLTKTDNLENWPVSDDPF